VPKFLLTLVYLGLLEITYAQAGFYGNRIMMKESAEPRLWRNVRKAGGRFICILQMNKWCCSRVFVRRHWLGRQGKDLDGEKWGKARVAISRDGEIIAAGSSYFDVGQVTAYQY